MKIIFLHGKEILPYIDRIIQLRIQLFKGWPYLYEGSLEYEESYFEGYVSSDLSTAVLVLDHDQVVGCAIGLPVAESLKEIGQIFKDQGQPSGKSYYLSDLLLQEEYRGKKIGQNMVQTLEKAVMGLQDFSAIYLCEIVRDPKDSRKPPHLHSLDKFWDKQGYEIVPDWLIQLKWLEVGAKKPISHDLRFRKKTMHL